MFWHFYRFSGGPLNVFLLLVGAAYGYALFYMLPVSDVKKFQGMIFAYLLIAPAAFGWLGVAFLRILMLGESSAKRRRIIVYYFYRRFIMLSMGCEISFAVMIYAVLMLWLENPSEDRMEPLFAILSVATVAIELTREMIWQSFRLDEVYEADVRRK